MQHHDAALFLFHLLSVSWELDYKANSTLPHSSGLEVEIKKDENSLKVIFRILNFPLKKELAREFDTNFNQTSGNAAKEMTI